MKTVTKGSHNTDNPPKKRRWRVSRRGFLIGLGITGVGAAVGLRFGVPEARLRVARVLDDSGPPGTIDAAPSVWFDITPENQVTLHLPKVEMGQGIHTSLAQIAAEELGCDWEQLQVVQTGTASGPEDGMGTSASNSVASLFTPLREAAASMRVMLSGAAASLLGVSTSSLVVEDGVIKGAEGEDIRLTFGEVVAQTDPDSWEAPSDPPSLKPISDFKLVGQSKPRVDLQAKLMGSAEYGYDKRLAGMLYGAVARPETLEGSLVSAGPGEAPNEPGVVSVIARNDFVGVAAESRAQAQAALDKLELRWEPGKLWEQDEIEALTTAQDGAGVVIQREGNAARELGRGSGLEAEYRTPMAMHAHLEPQAALVDVKPDKVRAWVSTQAAMTVRRDIARALGRDEDDVEVTPSYLGGGFGRKLDVEAAVEAARLSQAAGRPVHVGWTREEDFKHGYLRPPTHHRLRARLEGERITALEHQQASGDVAFISLPDIAATILGADFGAWRGATFHYDGVPHRRASAQRVKLPVRTGWWRGLGLMANTFAVESFIDELAHQVNQDPLKFRLAHLGSDERGHRFGNVLRAAAERAGWGASLPDGHALGIACCTDVKTVVAQVAEVSLEGGEIRVHNVTCAVDPGLVINPDGAKAQSEGAIIMGLSSTLLESVRIQEGKIDAANLNQYPLLGMRQSPNIDITLLESGADPYGMGEPPIGPIAAAVANAVFSLTGERLRHLPLSPNKEG